MIKIVEELERTRAAYAILNLGLSKMVSSWTGCPVASVKLLLEESGTILNPPPEMETVDETAWLYIDPRGNKHLVDERPEVAEQGYIAIVPLTGSYQRPKPQPVVKSVTINGALSSVGTVHGDGAATPFKYHTECHGKSGTITFTWTEEPS